jgi:hypothetical protein
MLSEWYKRASGQNQMVAPDKLQERFKTAMGGVNTGYTDLMTQATDMTDPYSEQNRDQLAMMQQQGADSSAESARQAQRMAAMGGGGNANAMSAQMMDASNKTTANSMNAFNQYMGGQRQQGMGMVSGILANQGQIANQGFQMGEQQRQANAQAQTQGAQFGANLLSEGIGMFMQEGGLISKLAEKGKDAVVNMGDAYENMKAELESQNTLGAMDGWDEMSPDEQQAAMDVRSNYNLQGGEMEKADVSFGQKAGAMTGAGLGKLDVMAGNAWRGAGKWLGEEDEDGQARWKKGLKAGMGGIRGLLSEVANPGTLAGERELAQLQLSGFNSNPLQNGKQSGGYIGMQSGGNPLDQINAGMQSAVDDSVSTGGVPMTPRDMSLMRGIWNTQNDEDAIGMENALSPSGGDYYQSHFEPNPGGMMSRIIGPKGQMKIKTRMGGQIIG